MPIKMGNNAEHILNSLQIMENIICCWNFKIWYH